MLIFREFDIQKNIATLNIFCFGAAQTILLPLLPVLREQTQLELSSLFFCISIGTLSFIPGTLFWARMGDVGKIDKALAFNVFALLLSLLLLTSHFLFKFPPITSLIIFLSGRIIWGLGVSGIPVLTQHIQVNLSFKTMKGFLDHSSGLNAGRLAGFLFALLPFQKTKMFIAVLAFVAVLLIMNFKYIEAQPKKTITTHSKVPYPALTLAILITSITGFLHSGLSAFLTLDLNFQATLTSELISKLLIVGSLVMIAGLQFGKKFRESEWKTMLIAGSCLLIAGLFSFSFIRNESALFMNIVVICSGLALVQPAPVMLVKSLTGVDSISASTLGSLSVVNTLGSGLGGMIIAMKTDSFQIAAMTLATVLFVVIVRTLFETRRELAWKI